MQSIGQTGFAAITGKSAPRHRLALFALGSLALHAALLGTASGTHSSVYEPPGSQNLTAVLVSPRTIAVKRPATHPAAAQHSPARDPSVQANAARTPANEQQGSRETDEQSASQAQQHEHLLGKVQTVLSRFLTYPHLAQRRGWEGRVILIFSLTTSGGIDDIALGQSSGYPTLDNAALTALNLARRHIQLAEHLSLVGNRLRLPVVYRLTES